MFGHWQVAAVRHTLDSESAERFGGVPGSRGDGTIDIRLLHDGRQPARGLQSIGTHEAVWRRGTTLNLALIRERGHADGNS